MSISGGISIVTGAIGSLGNLFSAATPAKGVADNTSTPAALERNSLSGDGVLVSLHSGNHVVLPTEENEADRTTSGFLGSFNSADYLTKVHKTAIPTISTNTSTSAAAASLNPTEQMEPTRLSTEGSSALLPTDSDADLKALVEANVELGDLDFDRLSTTSSPGGTGRKFKWDAAPTIMIDQGALKAAREKAYTSFREVLLPTGVKEEDIRQLFHTRNAASSKSPTPHSPGSPATVSANGSAHALTASSVAAAPVVSDEGRNIAPSSPTDNVVSAVATPAIQAAAAPAQNEGVAQKEITQIKVSPKGDSYDEYGICTGFEKLVAVMINFFSFENKQSDLKQP